MLKIAGVKIDEALGKKICDTIIRHDLLIKLHASMGLSVANIHLVIVADLRDMFAFLTLDALYGIQNAREVFNFFRELENYLYSLELREENFMVLSEIKHLSGIIFGYEQLLSLKHKIKLLPDEDLDRSDWERRFRETIKIVMGEDENGGKNIQNRD